ncbi:MAG TPA: hypothetical protein VIV10_01145 [Gemmatimonadales bacterium]
MSRCAEGAGDLEALFFTCRFYYHDTASTLASPADEARLTRPLRVLRERLGGTA